jgi:hypothetical protein
MIMQTIWSLRCPNIRFENLARPMIRTAFARPYVQEMSTTEDMSYYIGFVLTVSSGLLWIFNISNILFDLASLNGTTNAHSMNS